MSTNKVDLKPQTFLIAHSKGQKISKVNYVVLNSSKKNVRNICQILPYLLGQELFVRFLEDMRTSKSAFEIF